MLLSVLFFSYMTDCVSETSHKCSIIIESASQLINQDSYSSFSAFSTERHNFRNVKKKTTYSL